MKCKALALDDIESGESPPARGAWIEIQVEGQKGQIIPLSPPARGAWIEIYSLPIYKRLEKVAPREGGVD